MKKIIVVANWKMNPQSLKGAKLLFDAVKRGMKGVKNVEAVICPPFIYLTNLNPKPYALNPKLGAQDCFWEEKGAFTGEVSPLMLKNLGCQYVILGHSERRRYFQETDETVNKKIKAALQAGLKPILCVGETEKERKAGRTKEILKEQLKKGLESILNLKSEILNLVIAYEPVWAIGTGKSCAWQDAGEINLFIMSRMLNISGVSPAIKNFAKRVPVLYGGSVNSQNGADYIKKAGFDGLLVGGASLDSREFAKIVKIAAGT